MYKSQYILRYNILTVNYSPLFENCGQPAGAESDVCTIALFYVRICICNLGRSYLDARVTDVVIIIVAGLYVAVHLLTFSVNTSDRSHPYSAQCRDFLLASLLLHRTAAS